MTEAEVVAALIIFNGLAAVALIYWRLSAGSVKGMKDRHGWDIPLLVMLALAFAGAADLMVILAFSISVIASWIS